MGDGPVFSCIGNLPDLLAQLLGIGEFAQPITSTVIFYEIYTRYRSIVKESLRKLYGNRIINQLKCLGSSCDWSRLRFTMDEGCSKAVKEVFVNLYEKGLIYQGNRIINWCPCCKTALSDAEVEFIQETIF